MSGALRLSGFCRGAEWRESGLEVGFVEEGEVVFGEDGGGQGGVIDMDDDGAGDVLGGDEGVAVVDIDFSGEEGFGDFGEAGVGGGGFDGDEVADAEGVVGVEEGAGGFVGVVEDEADDGAVETLDDGEGEDTDIGVIKDADELGEGTDAIFGKDGDLADTGGVAAAVGFWLLTDHGHVFTVAWGVRRPKIIIDFGRGLGRGVSLLRETIAGSGSSQARRGGLYLGMGVRLLR